MNQPFRPKKIQVPGLLSDDALQEQLKQFADVKNAQQDAAPPPSSAVDFSARIQSEYLDSPMRAATQSASVLLPGPLGPLTNILSSGVSGLATQAGPQRSERLQGQDRAIDLRSSYLQDMLDAAGGAGRRGLLGPVVGEFAEGGIFSHLGTLNEEEQQVEAERRAADARDREAAFKTRAAMREQLRGLSDEDAAALGLPVPPAPTDQETLQEQSAQDAARVEAAEKTTEDAEAAVADKAKQPTQTWWLDAVQRGGKSAADVPVSALKYGPIAWELTVGRVLNGGDIERSDVRAWVDTVDQTLTKMLPGDKARAKDFVSELSAGGGSMLAYMLAGFVGGAIGLPAGAATTMLGAAGGGVRQFEDAEAFNAVGLQKYMALIMGTGLGATEALPINRMLLRADTATGGLVRRLLTNTAAGSMEEFLQELGQSVGEDVVAKWLYDESRDLDARKYLRQAAIGGITGGLAGASIETLSQSGVAPVKEGEEKLPANDAQRETVALTAIDLVQSRIDQIEGMPDVEAALDAETTMAQIEPAAPQPSAVMTAGGTIPVDQNGQLTLSHWSSNALEVIDPAKRGTGPLRGVERSRLFGENAVDRSYYGVGDPEFPRNFQLENAKLPPRKRAVKKPTDPYHGEGLGPYRHSVSVDPNTMYNWYEDPLNLKAKLDRDAPPTEQVTAYEKLIKDAGFDGIYFSESRLGQTAMLFRPAKASNVVDERYNLPVADIATPRDFTRPTPEAFQKGGWAIVTATQESLGDARAPANVEANEKLRAELDRKKIPYQEVAGAYKGVEQDRSFLIFAPEAEAAKLGKKYKQESILTRRGLEYSDGTITPVDATRTVVGDAARQEDFYSTLPGGETFSLGLDFERTYDPAVVTVDPKTVEVPEDDLKPLAGLTTSGGPIKSVVQAARAYAQSKGLPIRRQAEYVRVDPERAARIAQAYDQMEHAPEDPAVKRAYKAMIDETLEQYQFVKATGLKIEAIEPGQPDPYPEGPKQVLEDLQNGHLWFFPTDQGFGSEPDDATAGWEPPSNAEMQRYRESLPDREPGSEAEDSFAGAPEEFLDNPLLAPTEEKIGNRTLLANDVFRIVHDFFGHGIEGSGFGARGEENAWQSHMRLYSEEALPAVTSETRGQNSWVNYGPFGEQNRANQRDTVYADQKTGIMPEWTWREGVEDDFASDDIFARVEPETPERVRKLADQIPGLKGVMRYMTPDERAKLTKANAQKIVDLFSSAPDPKEMAAVAYSGRAKRGWYERSARAFVDIFGLEDAPRFAALLAALSPQTSVESNAVNALTMWANWVRAGRPTETSRIRALLGASVQGGKGEGSVLPAWIDNSITALTEPDALSITLSGPKVDSFMRNLQGRVVEVTNDAWMANFANVDQTLFKKTGAKPGKSPGYVGMSAAVRKAAEVATKLTGEPWSPAEIQETVWSWAKTLYEKAGSAGENRSAQEIIKAGDMSAEEIAATPDFATLFVSGVYRNILEKGGYNVDELAAGSAERDGSDGRGSRPDDAEGSGFAQRAFDRHLKNAAARLDALRARRAETDEPQGVDFDETFFPEEPAQENIGNLTEDDLQAIDEGVFAARGTATRRSSYKGEQARPARGVAGAGGEDVSLAKISRNVIKLLDLTARQGRFTLKGSNVMGQYSAKQNVVRLRTWNDLSTLVHEGGHALQAAAGPELKAFIDGNKAELTKVATALYGGDVSKMTPSTQVAEGFAEFFRIYTLNRNFAQTKYPGLTSAFDGALDAGAPQLKEGLDLVGQQFAAWLQLPSAQLVRNMVVPGTKPGALEASLQELRDKGFGTWMHEYSRAAVETGLNRYASVNDLVNEILNIGQENRGAAIDLKRADDPRTLIRLARNFGARAMVEATDGVMGYRSVTPMTRGLREALLLSQGLKADQNLSRIDPERQRDFASYLVALRGADEYRRFAEGKIERPPLAATLGDLKKTIDEMDAKYPEFGEAAGIVHEYGMGLWKKGFDAGLVSKEAYEGSLERAFYAPLQRDMSDKRAQLGEGPLTGGRSIVKRFRGSDRDILDPMDVLLQKTFSMERAIAENDVKKALASLADRAGKAGALVEHIPAHQLIGKQFSVQEVARQLTRDDTLSEVDAADLMSLLELSIENDNLISLFRSEQASTKGENVLFYWDKGKLAAIQLADGDIGADVVNTVNGVGRENLPLFVDLIGATSTAFRASITSWPDFLAVNFIRDQMSAFILTDVGFKPFVTGLKGVGDELRQSEWARLYNASMGIRGGMNVATIHEARVDHDLNSLRKKGYIARAFNAGGMFGAVRGMANVVELTETGTRVGIFRSAFERAKKDGLSDYEASVEASYIATDYIDFGLNGSRMLLFRRTIPFLNAQLQGLYKMMRTLGADEVRQRKGLNFALRAYFKDLNGLDLSRTEKQALQTGRKAWVKMASLGLLSAALHFLFEDDPDYQDASEYLRQTGWVIPVGDGRIFYIPKPFELAVLANFTERAFEAASGDPMAKKRFLRGLAMTMTPPTSPPAIQIAVELAANKDFFTGRDIVPDYMRALEPELQYNNYTTTFAKQIGEATGMSPMVVDHVLSGMGASAYRDLTTMYNMTDPNRATPDATDMPFTRRFVRDARRGAVSAQDFWRYASTVDGLLRRAELTYRNYLESGNTAKADAYLDQIDDPDIQAYAVLNAHFKTDAKRLNPFYRGRQLSTIVSAMRREMVSELGLEDTTSAYSEPIKLTASEKAKVDEVLSEFIRREVRNTLIYMRTPGWVNKKPLDVEASVDLLGATEPRVAEELARRIRKAKVYPGDFVQEYWPEVRDRLTRDRENTFLKDVLAIAKALR